MISATSSDLLVIDVPSIESVLANVHVDSVSGEML